MRNMNWPTEDATQGIAPEIDLEEILSSPLTQDMLQTLPGPPLQPSPLLITQTFPGTSPSMLVARGSAPQVTLPSVSVAQLGSATAAQVTLPSVSVPQLGSATAAQVSDQVRKKVLVVVEQPRERGMRFRYKCEGRSAGSIPGASSTDKCKRLPTIEIQGSLEGVKNIRVTVSLVTKDSPHRPHPHSLVGNACSGGICVVHLKPTCPRHSFSNLGIQCVTKKEMDSALEQRRSRNIDPFNTGHTKGIEDMDMNSVRLCFQCEVEEEGGEWVPLEPVVSNPIYDNKATVTSELKIYRLNVERGPCTGRTEIYMLCDKVQKDDIEIIFSKDSWEAMGEFAQTDVHRQIAIVFKSPPYQDLDIIEEVEVSVVLRRPSDRMHSESVTFTYLPGNPDPYGINRKRKIKPDGNFSTDPCVSACHLTLPEPSAPELLGQFTCAALQHPLTCAASQASGAAVESTPLLPQAELDCYDPDCLEGLSPEDQSVLISVINQIMLESMDVGAPCPAPSVGQNQQLLSAVSEYQALEPSLYDLSLPALEADRLPDLGNIDLNFDLGATPDSQSRQLAGGNEFVNFSHFMFSQSENLPTFLEPHPQDQIGSSSQGIGTGDADVQAEPQACTDPVASGKPGL